MMYYKKFLQPFFIITGIAFKRWWDKDPFMQSAVIAYYAIFSIPGLLVIVISAGALFYKQDVIIGQLNTQISSVMGIETARQVQEMIISISNSDNS
jgi:membrane protein